MITKDQIEALKSRGYYVENMEEEHGEEFAGNYRWMNDDYYEFGFICYSEDEAWTAAYNFASMPTA